MLNNIQTVADIDKIVGRQLRLLRIAKGYTQSALAEKLNITYQQIQKYENGDNRISAGRIWQLADTFKVDPNTLFDILIQRTSPDSLPVHTDHNEPSSNPVDPLYVNTTEEMRLLSAFKDIANRSQRSLIVKMAQAFSYELSDQNPAH